MKTAKKSGKKYFVQKLRVFFKTPAPALDSGLVSKLPRKRRARQLELLLPKSYSVRTRSASSGVPESPVPPCLPERSMCSR